jgi:hypothetical protein
MGKWKLRTTTANRQIASREDRTDEARLTREAGDTSVEVGFNLASRVTSRESQTVSESIYLSNLLVSNLRGRQELYTNVR